MPQTCAIVLAFPEKYRNVANNQEASGHALRKMVQPKKRSGRKPGTTVNAAKLKQYRGNLSQEEFADKCGVSVDTIQRGEAGRRWGDRNFIRVAEAIELLTGRSFKLEDLKNRTNRKN